MYISVWGQVRCWGTTTGKKHEENVYWNCNDKGYVYNKCSTLSDFFHPTVIQPSSVDRAIGAHIEIH